MKKIVALLLFGSIAFTSCSSDDNKNTEDDPIFSQPYVELKSLDELEIGKYAYVGIKIGDRKVGVIGESSNCKREDYLLVHRTSTNAVLDSITYNNYRLDKVDDKLKCVSIFEFPRLLHKNNLVSPGILRTTIEDGYMEEIPSDPEHKEYKRKPYYSGQLEIGFQAGYLRIEDHLSDYRYLKDEKVYLYFEKM